jgi:hypothetical protein
VDGAEAEYDDCITIVYVPVAFATNVFESLPSTAVMVAVPLFVEVTLAVYADEAYALSNSGTVALKVNGCPTYTVADDTVFHVYPVSPYRYKLAEIELGAMLATFRFTIFVT